MAIKYPNRRQPWKARGSESPFGTLETPSQELEQLVPPQHRTREHRNTSLLACFQLAFSLHTLVQDPELGNETTGSGLGISPPINAQHTPYRCTHRAAWPSAASLPRLFRVVRSWQLKRTSTGTEGLSHSSQSTLGPPQNARAFCENFLLIPFLKCPPPSFLGKAVPRVRLSPSYFSMNANVHPKSCLSAPFPIRLERVVT